MKNQVICRSLLLAGLVGLLVGLGLEWVRPFAGNGLIGGWGVAMTAEDWGTPDTRTWGTCTERNPRTEWEETQTAPADSRVVQRDSRAVQRDSRMVQGDSRAVPADVLMEPQLKQAEAPMETQAVHSEARSVQTKTRAGQLRKPLETRTDEPWNVRVGTDAGAGVSAGAGAGVSEGMGAGEDVSAGMGEGEDVFTGEGVSTAKPEKEHRAMPGTNDQWRSQTARDTDWLAKEKAGHPVPPPADNHGLLKSGQKEGSVYKDFSEQDLILWQQETERLVMEGARIFHSDERLGSTNGVSCDMCHPDGRDTHPETYPKYQVQLGRAALLRDMINWCLENPCRGTPLSGDSPEMRALEAYILAMRAGKTLEYGKH